MTEEDINTIPEAPVEAPKKKRTYRKKKVEEPKEEVSAAPAEEKTEEVKEQLEEGQTPHKKVPEQFLKDLDEFAAILEANPPIIDPIREVFEYHLIDPIDRKTFPKMVNAMSMLLGPAATMVVMTGCHVNSAAFFEDLVFACKGNDKAKAAVWIIQHLTSLYGNRVQKAYTLSSGTMDEDWHTIDVNTYRREGENPVWTIDMVVNLYNGKDSHIRMTPDSAFQLVEILMAELANNVPVEQVDAGLVAKCRDTCKAFMEKFYSGADEEDTEGEEDPAGYA
ncbi:MAG: hypothetical protein E7Z71_03225 [Methanocorpusculum parvum]|nr:hypothetical protein [Methanocorpusculum parvum]